MTKRKEIQNNNQERNYGKNCNAYELRMQLRGEAVKRTVQILANAGYYQIERNEEMVWMKNGEVSYMPREKIKPFKTCCIKVEYGKNDMKLFGWILDLAGNEIPLHGIVGAMKKHSVKKTMRKIQSTISNT